MTEEPANMPPACVSLLAYFAREMGLDPEDGWPISELPAGALAFDTIILTATSCPPPTFRARLIRAAHRYALPALLLRSFVTEGSEMITAEVAMPFDRHVLISFDLMPFLDRRQLWLLPTRDRSPCYSVGPGGVELATEPPYDSDDALKLGMRRATADILRARDLHPTLN